MPLYVETVEPAVVSDPGPRHGLARLSQFIDYAFMLLYSLLFLRLLLVFVGARQGAGFVQFVDAVTNPFYSPFRGIVASPEVAEGFTLAVPLLVALLAYGLLHLAINRLLRVIVYRRTGL
jgi:uncharacterized protein YggT (Ycf19 family)